MTKHILLRYRADRTRSFSFPRFFFFSHLHCIHVPLADFQGHRNTGPPSCTKVSLLKKIDFASPVCCTRLQNTGYFDGRKRVHLHEDRKYNYITTTERVRSKISKITISPSIVKISQILFQRLTRHRRKEEARTPRRRSRIPEASLGSFGKSWRLVPSLGIQSRSIC